MTDVEQGSEQRDDRTYEAPEVRILGRVDEVTQGVDGSPVDDSVPA